MRHTNKLLFFLALFVIIIALQVRYSYCQNTESECNDSYSEEMNIVIGDRIGELERITQQLQNLTDRTDSISNKRQAIDSSLYNTHQFNDFLLFNGVLNEHQSSLYVYQFYLETSQNHLGEILPCFDHLVSFFQSRAYFTEYLVFLSQDRLRRLDMLKQSISSHQMLYLFDLLKELEDVMVEYHAVLVELSDPIEFNN